MANNKANLHLGKVTALTVVEARIIQYRRDGMKWKDIKAQLGWNSDGSVHAAYLNGMAKQSLIDMVNKRQAAQALTAHEVGTTLGNARRAVRSSYVTKPLGKYK